MNWKTQKTIYSFRRKHGKIHNLYSSNIRRSYEVTTINENGEEVAKNISYISQCIDKARFMASSLSNPANNLSEGIPRIKCKYGYDDKKREICGITYEVCDCFLEYTTLKDDLIERKCLCRNKSLMKKFLKNFLIYTSFLSTTTISLFYYCEKVFILMNIWMIQKNSMKYYLKKKNFTVT